jgi:NAD(P)H-quinone oxidoreductase subunit 5
MTGQDHSQTVGQLSTDTTESPLAPTVLTRLAWTLFAASLAALVGRLAVEGPLAWGPFAVDGLTVVMWTVVTFFSAVVHSYARRYMAGSERVSRFFGGVFAFTLAVLVLVAADHLALFAAAWLAMGLAMADLVGTVRGWPQAQAAARLARRYFLASSALLAAALGVLWWTTGASTVSGVAPAVDTMPATARLLAVGLLVVAAMIQSALVPFHRWLLSSMTAPTPASALMHAGFVNAGGILLARFAPVVTVEAAAMLAILIVGASSALAGKLLKTVQSDVKAKLGCSTVGQMGFMLMQAGLGFFGAAITHLILHGCYKAYQFLSAGEAVEQTRATGSKATGSSGPVGWTVTALTALAGGGLFAVLTGKGTTLDAGLVLVAFVVVTTLHAARNAVARTDLPAALRYGAVPLVFLPAIAVYAGVYLAVTGLMAGLPVVTAPTALTPIHGLVVAAFAVAYVAIDTGVYRHSDRLYVTLLNAARPAPETLLTSTEDYNEY